MILLEVNALLEIFWLKLAGILYKYCRSWLNCDRMGQLLNTVRFRYRFRYPDSVDSGGKNAASVPGAFAGRVQALDVEALQVFATGQTQRRRGAGFNAGEHRIGQGKAANLPVEGGQRFADGSNGVIGEGAGKISQMDPGLVRRGNRAEFAYGRPARKSPTSCPGAS